LISDFDISPGSSKEKQGKITDTFEMKPQMTALQNFDNNSKILEGNEITKD
jgi:hypothetical protein